MKSSISAGHAECPIYFFRLFEFQEMLAAIRRHDWFQAADKLGRSLWFTQQGGRGYELQSKMRYAKTAIPISAPMQQFNMERFKDDLKHFEGVRLHVYTGFMNVREPGKPTNSCGVGHPLKPGVHGMPVGTPITEEDMMTYLNKDCQDALNDSRRLLGVSIFDQFPEDVQLVLANMMFYFGYSRSQAKTSPVKGSEIDMIILIFRLSGYEQMIADVKRHDWSSAADKIFKSLKYYSRSRGCELEVRMRYAN